MTTTEQAPERITLPEIPGVTYDCDGGPMWEDDQLEATRREIGSRITDIHGEDLVEAVLQLGEDVDSAEDFDELMSLIRRLRDRALVRRSILAEGGWSQHLASTFRRQERIDIILRHRDAYDALAAKRGLPLDPNDLNASKVGQVALAVELLVDPETSETTIAKLLEGGDR